MISQFLKFIFFGLINTAVGLSVIFFALRFLDATPLAANAAGYAVGLVVSFSLNGKITFGQGQLSAPMFARFLLVMLAAYVANVEAMWMTLPHGKYVAEVAGMAIYTIASFIGCRLFVFRGASPN